MAVLHEGSQGSDLGVCLNYAPEEFESSSKRNQAKIRQVVEASVTSSPDHNNLVKAAFFSFAWLAMLQRAG